MPSKAEVEEWAEIYRVAWETADSEAVAALFSEDSTYRDQIYEEPHRGRAGVIAYWNDVTSAQTNVTVQMGAPIVDGSRASVEFWTTMNVEDAPVTLAGCLLLDFDDDGLCSALREYWNFADGTQQQPDGWGS